MFKNRKRKGFTLIELVIVIAIIGILAAIAIPRFSNSTEKAQNTKIEANARTLASAVGTKYATDGTWATGDSLSETAGLDKAKYTIQSADKDAIIIKVDEEYSGSAANAYTDAKAENKFEKSGTNPMTKPVYFKY